MEVGSSQEQRELDADMIDDGPQPNNPSFNPIRSPFVISDDSNDTTPHDDPQSVDHSPEEQQEEEEDIEDEDQSPPETPPTDMSLALRLTLSRTGGPRLHTPPPRPPPPPPASSTDQQRPTHLRRTGSGGSNNLSRFRSQNRSRSPASTSMNGTQRQCVIDRETHVESPVPNPVPGLTDSSVHQMMVLTIPANCFRTHKGTFMNFVERDPIARGFERLLVLMSRMVKLAGVTHTMPENGPTDRDADSEANSNAPQARRARARAAPAPDSIIPVYTVGSRSGYLKTYQYFEMLSVQPDVEERADEPIRHRFGGIRVFLFLMDPSLDLGRLMHRCLLDGMTVAHRRRIPDDVREMLPRTQNELLQELFRVHLDERTLFNRSGSNGPCAVGEQISQLQQSDLLLSMDIRYASDSYHPHQFFSLNRSMLMHVSDIRPSQRSMQFYEDESDGSFNAFPFPDLVTYIPPETFSDLWKLRQIPIVNNYTKTLARQQMERGRDLLSDAMIDKDLKMTDGLVRTPPGDFHVNHCLGCDKCCDRDWKESKCSSQWTCSIHALRTAGF